jgi:hypothetical protein
MREMYVVILTVNFLRDKESVGCMQDSLEHERALVPNVEYPRFLSMCVK